MRIGINLSLAASGRAFGIDGLVEHIADVHRQGFAFASLAQIQGVDALTAFAVAGRNVPDIELLTAVIPVYPRHPVTLAQQALTTQDACHGRLALGIGLSHRPVVENTWGMSFERPLEYMREYLAILQPLLHGQPASFKGKRLTGQVQLSLAPVEAPPVILAALGENMLALAGEQADGTATWMVGAKTLASHITPVLRAAASSAGRPEPRIIAGLPICVTSDAAAVRARAARGFERYGQLPSYRAMLDREGAAGPADLALAGSETEVTDRIGALRDIGVTDFAPVEIGGDPDESAATRDLLRRLAPTLL